MKVLRFALAAALALALPGAALGQTFGQFTGAEPLAVNSHLIGGYIQSSENTLSVLSQLRLSFYPGVDFGFLGGVARQDYGTEDRTTLRLGTDLKYAIIPSSAGMPFAMAIGGALGVETGDEFSILTVGPTVVASRSFNANSETTVAPFVGAAILFSNVNVDPTDESFVSFPVRAGAELRFTPQLALTGELDFRFSDDFYDDVGFSLGVNLPF